MSTHESVRRSEQVASLTPAIIDTAKAMSPEIVMHGLGRPDYLPVNPRKFKRFLPVRFEVEQALTDAARLGDQSNVGWSFSDGLYRSYDDFRNTNDTATGEHQLGDIELMIADRIDGLLNESELDKPVVAMDFGGGRGMSWLRIASQPKYRTAIEDGRLAMVITNLGFTPDSEPDSEGYTGVARSMNADNALYKTGANVCTYSQKEMEWAQNNQNLVHNIDANALELSDAIITLPDGNELPLAGNVDIIHERLALAHTHVPDLALANFSRILSQRGVLFSDAATYYHLPHPSQVRSIKGGSEKVISIDGNYETHRRLALVVGSKMLQLNGFSYTNVPDKHFAIFDRVS